MSKGIIVVDTPDKCCNCRMGFVNEYYDQFECFFKPGIEIKPDVEKPDWCPIRPLPDRKSPSPAPSPMLEKAGYFTPYEKGWNDCIEEIEGEDNESDHEVSGE